MINENLLSDEPDRVDNADTSAVPQEALEIIHHIPSVGVYQQLQMADNLPSPEPLNLESLFRAVYDLQYQRQHVLIRHEEMDAFRQESMREMAQQLMAASSRRLYERVMGNFTNAIPETDEQLARRHDDSPTKIPVIRDDELQPQEPITDLRLQMLAAREERINSLAKHANALRNNLMTSRKLEKQFPDPSKRFDEVHRFVKSLGLE